MRTTWLIFLPVLLAVSVTPAFAQKNNDILGDDYSIMMPEKGAKPKLPEPWLAPKYKSPRGTVKHAHNCARKHFVGARRTRAIDVGETNDEIVYAADRRDGRHEFPA